MKHNKSDIIIVCSIQLFLAIRDNYHVMVMVMVNKKQI